MDMYLTTHNTEQKTDFHAPGEIRTRNPSWRAASVLRRRDRQIRHYSYVGKKGKAIPLQAWTGPEGSRRLRLPDFMAVGK